MNKKISLIIPAYNAEKYINKCISSVIEQTYRNIDIVIVDDGSKDRTNEICRCWCTKDRRIRYFEQENMGVVSARQVGIDNALGEYVGFVDADDWIEPDMVEHMIEKIKDADMISVGTYYHNGKDTIQWTDYYKEGLYSDSRLDEVRKTMLYNEDTIINALTSSMWNKLYKRKLILDIHRELDSTLSYGEDLALNILFLLRCESIVISHSCFYHYNLRENTATDMGVEEALYRLYKLYGFVHSKIDQADKYNIMYQLQEYVIWHVNFERVGFDERCRIPEFVSDLEDQYGKCIVLYGAGKVGQSIYHQRRKLGITINNWVDAGYEKYRKKGLPVNSPESIPGSGFDLIYVAISDSEMAQEIIDSLTKLGVENNKILWRKPYKLHL